MEVPEIPNLIHYAIPFFIITLVLEILVDARARSNSYETKDAITSIIMGLGNVFLGLISKVLLIPSPVSGQETKLKKLTSMHLPQDYRT